jgi:phage-related protein
LALNLGELNAIIDADDRGFRRTISRVHDKMDATGKKMGGLTGLLGVLGKATAFASLATGAAGLASALGPAISAAGALVVAVGAAGAAIPAFAAGGAAAIGTLKLGFVGLQDAIEGDEAALQKLPPAARDIVTAVKGLAPAWDKVTRSVQERLWTGLADDFTDIAGKILPKLESGLGGIASAFNTVGKNALDALDSKEVLGGLDKALKATQGGIAAFAQGVKPALEGVGLLIGAFSPLLVDAGEAAASLAQRFRDWVGEAVETGRVNDMIATLKDTLSTLGSVVVNIGSILGSVFSAANDTSGGLLNTIETLTGRLSDFFKSAKGQDALNSFFTALAAVADDVVPIVLELADAFATDLAPHIATIAEEVGPSLRDLVRELGDAIGKIDVATLADGFADVLDAVVPLIGPLGDFLGWVTSIKGLVPAIVIALGLWTVAQWALNAALYANPIVWIIAAVIALIAIIVLLVANWDTVSQAIIDASAWLYDMWVSIFTAIGDFFVDIWNAIKNFFIGIWNSITTTVVGIWNSIKAFFVSIWNAIVNHARGQVNALLAVIGWISSLPGKVSGWFQGVYNAAKDKLNSLVDWVKGIPDRIMSALGNLGSLLKNAGRDIINGLLDGIQEKFGAVQDKLSDLTNMLPDWKGPPEKDKTILGPAGEMVIGGFVDGLQRAIPTVQRALAGLTTDIGLQVDGTVGNTMRVDATASLSDDDRALLRELAEARNRVDVQLGANLTQASAREYAMAVD